MFRLLLVLTLSVFWMTPVYAGQNLRIGAQCDTAQCNEQPGSSCGNNECLSGDCEDSSREEEDDDFCDCDDVQDCANEYGTQIGESWECIDGTHATYDLDYCLSNVRGPKYPIEPREASAVDFITDPSVGADQIQKEALTKPVTQVAIPGVSLSKPEVVSDNGKTFLSIPFLGQYVAGIYKYFIAAVIVVAIVKILDGSIIMVMSRGDSDKVGHAKEAIGGAVIGLAIAVTSYSILYMINPNLVQFKPLRVEVVERDTLYDILESSNNDIYGSGTLAKNCDQYDKIFQAYAPCMGADWRALKAIASVESGCNPAAENSIGFVGMGQTKPKFCKGIFEHAGYSELASHCTVTDLKTPEVGIAVISLLQRDAAKLIKAYCKNAPPKMQGAAFHAYNNVPAAAKLFIKGGCQNIEDFVQYFNINMPKKQSYLNTEPYKKKYGNLLPNEAAFLRAIGTAKIMYAVQHAGPVFEAAGGEIDNPVTGGCPLKTSDPFFKKTSL